MNSRARLKLSSSQLIPLSFLGAIIVGTILLMLPIAKAGSGSADFTTAFFTSTTSTCVTGLVVVDTFSYWSLFGKIVILCLIQLGGLGIIAVTSILMLMIHRKFSLFQSIMLHDAFNLNSLTGLKKFLKGVFLGTFAVEMFGALIYMIKFIPEFGGVRGVWYSVFTAISAFCNAGIDIIGPDSLIGYQSDPLVMYNSMFLIIMGGLGYVVWFDLYRTIREKRRKDFSFRKMLGRLSEHTKLVLVITIILIFGGALLVFCMEYDNPETIGNMSLGDKITNSIFQSVTFRTAGFAAVPQQGLTEGTCTLGALLMFIGGSPVGTAGGVKTITFFALLLNTVSFIRNRKENAVFGRRFTSDLIHKATAIITVSFAVTFFFLMLLIAVSQVSLVDGMYEMFSATATVGLSRGLTPTLNLAGKWLVVVAMYLGRIGPISMALFFNYESTGKNQVSYAKGNFFVG